MAEALATDRLGKVFSGGRTLLGRARRGVHAVSDVSLSVRQGETLGIVGESGSGKSTLARMLAGLLTPTQGSIKIGGKDLAEHFGDPCAFGKLVQYVFQDPISSLNPRKRVRQILEAPLVRLHGMGLTDRKARIAELLDAVNLRDDVLERYPHEFSGGQAQRIGIARALAASARILILDEPVSALDVSVQAQVLKLLVELRERFDLTYLFITHDLAVVEAVSDRIAVFYFGRMVELGDAKAVLGARRHPYTYLLLRSVPTIGSTSMGGKGQIPASELPDPLNPPPGCAFAARCPNATRRCGVEPPKMTAFGEGHEASCHNPIT